MLVLFRIYDTKFIVHHTQFNKKLTGGSSLGLITDLCRKPDDDFDKLEILLDDKFKEYDFQNNKDLGRCHEAGYDSFLTGFVYLKMFGKLSKEEQDLVKNSINSMKSMYYLKLGSEDDLMYTEVFS